jgi:hypothetical protein
MRKCRKCGETRDNKFYGKEKGLCRKCALSYHRQRYATLKLLRPPKEKIKPAKRGYTKEMREFEYIFTVLINTGWFHSGRVVAYQEREGKTPEEKLSILLAALHDQERKQRQYIERVKNENRSIG